MHSRDASYTVSHVLNLELSGKDCERFLDVLTTAMQSMSQDMEENQQATREFLSDLMLSLQPITN